MKTAHITGARAGEVAAGRFQNPTQPWDILGQQVWQEDLS